MEAEALRLRKRSQTQAEAEEDLRAELEYQKQREVDELYAKHQSAIAALRSEQAASVSALEAAIDALRARPGNAAHADQLATLSSAVRGLQSYHARLHSSPGAALAAPSPHGPRGQPSDASTPSRAHSLTSRQRSVSSIELRRRPWGDVLWDRSPRSAEQRAQQRAALATAARAALGAAAAQASDIFAGVEEEEEEAATEDEEAEAKREAAARRTAGQSGGDVEGGNEGSGSSGSSGSGDEGRGGGGGDSSGSAEARAGRRRRRGPSGERTEITTTPAASSRTSNTPSEGGTPGGEATGTPSCADGSDRRPDQRRTSDGSKSAVSPHQPHRRSHEGLALPTADGRMRPLRTATSGAPLEGADPEAAGLADDLRGLPLSPQVATGVSLPGPADPPVSGGRPSLATQPSAGDSPYSSSETPTVGTTVGPEAGGGGPVLTLRAGNVTVTYDPRSLSVQRACSRPPRRQPRRRAPGAPSRFTVATAEEPYGTDLSAPGTHTLTAPGCTLRLHMRSAPGCA